MAANDHVHTRLTHSLEVAQVGRALGKCLGIRIEKELPTPISATDLGTIVRAACLAHDIGNPPFGHAGEESMIHWFDINGHKLFGSLAADHKRDLIAYEGNAQGFRVLTQTENHLFAGGLRLTYATLGSYLKYPWSSRKLGKKFNAFLTEEAILQKIANELGLVKTGEHEWARHPLAHLVEAADDICYGIMDLEDAVELKIVQYDAVEDLLLSEFTEKEKEEIRKRLEKKAWHRVNFSRLRGPVFDFVVSGAIDAFMLSYDKIMNGTFGGGLFDALPAGDPRRKLIAKSKAFAVSEVFQDPKKVELELSAYATLECLLNAFCGAALECGQRFNSPNGEIGIHWRSKLILQLLGDDTPSSSNAPPGITWSGYQCLRRVMDFISGMTDNYAIYIAKQLQGMGFSGLQRP